MKRGPLLSFVGIVLGFLVYVGTTVDRVSPTMDEPLHAVGAWHTRYAADHRIDREDPALWRWWVSLFVGREDVARALPPGEWPESPEWTSKLMNYYREVTFTTAPEPGQVVYHARASSVLVGVGLLVSVGVIGWKVGGKWVGLVAMAAAAMDPLLLGHAVLVKTTGRWRWCLYGRPTWRGHRRNAPGRFWYCWWLCFRWSNFRGLC